jgi:tetratricopeptide (TPR) repeat protein
MCRLAPPERRVESTLRLAEMHLRAGERPSACDTLERAIESIQDSKALANRLAGLYREDAAWDLLAQLLTTQAMRSEGAARLGLLREAADLYLDKLDDRATAIPILEQIVELDPADLRERLRLAHALLAGERYVEAADVLEQQIRLYGTRKPKDRAIAHLALARAKNALGDRKRAIEELEHAAKIDPAHVETLDCLARLAKEEGLLEKAEQALRALLLLLGRASALETAGARSRGRILEELAAIAELRGDSERAAEFRSSARAAGAAASAATSAVRPAAGPPVGASSSEGTAPAVRLLEARPKS